MAQPNTDSKWTRPTVAVGMLLIYGATIAAVSLLNNDTLRVSVLGSVPVIVTLIVQHYFGNSASNERAQQALTADSEAKTAALATSSPVAPRGSTSTVTSTTLNEDQTTTELEQRLGSGG